MKYIVNIVGFLTIVITISGCSIDPSFYSEITASNFYDTKQNVYQTFYRPYAQYKSLVASGNDRWQIQEYGTDEMCIPTRGGDWYDGGQYQEMHYHIFSPERWTDAWYHFAHGVAQCLDAWDDYADIDLTKFNFTNEEIKAMEAEMQALRAAYYLEGLDMFGGCGLYNSLKEPVKGRSTDVETFNHIDSLLKLAIPNLVKKTVLGDKEIGTLKMAAAAAIKAKLYFNANAYIRKEMFAECAEICRDILAGKYGTYQLEDDWTNIFGFNNEFSTEIIWSCPSEFSVYQVDGSQHWAMHPFNARHYLGGIDEASYNGICLTPSLKPDGTPYSEYKLGSPFSKFEDTDVRKQLYVYLGDGKYRGMFEFGPLVNPLDGGVCRGTRENEGDTLVLVDQIAHLSKVGEGKQYASVSELPSNIGTGEENSGIRIMKRSPLPSYADRHLKFNPDIPYIRLAEIYYMLAECELRLGNKETAAELINTVRRRYFENGNDPNPVTASNLDKYRMLNEWMVEFIGEARRRTDLIRWDAYVTEAWWDHKPTNDPTRNRMPLSTTIMATNNLLEQNPGY